MGKQTAIHVSLLLAVCGAVLFTNLGTPKLWDRDEPRNAGCAREMLDRGDWVTPIFNDELREQKPVLLYWLIMSAYSVFGVGEFAARFWSAALATGTCLWAYFMARRLMSPQAALWAGLVLATCLMFDVAARAATPDSVLMFCGTSAIGFWVWGTFAANSTGQPRTWAEPGLRTAGVWFPREIRYVLPIYGMMGLGVLAKGPVGFVLPIAILGLFNLLARLPAAAGDDEPQGLIARRLSRLLRPWHPIHFLKTTWSMRPLTAALVVLIVAAPWYVWVGMRTEGDFLAGFFIKEHFGRATTAMESHSGGWWFYPMALLVGTFPWSILAIPISLFIDRSLSRPRNDRPLGIVLGCVWVLLYLAVFTFAKTKLPSYITPCYPGVALLAGYFLQQLALGKPAMHRQWWWASLGVLGSVGLVIAVGVPIATEKLFPGAQWLGAIGLVPLIGAIVTGWLVCIRADHWVPVSLSAIAVLFATGLFGVGAVTVDRYQQSNELLSEVREQPGALLGSFGVLESSWVFYSGQPIYELQPSSATDSVSLEREKTWKPKPRLTVAQFLGQSGRHYLLTTDTQLPELQRLAPGQLTELGRVPYFLNDEQLILLGTPGEWTASRAGDEPNELR